MNLIDRIKYIFGSKASQGRIAMSMERLGQPVTTPENYLGYSKEGYQKNVTVYRCIRIIATAAAGIKWEVYQNDREVTSGPVNQLLSQPNPMQGWASFFESVVGYYMISGNTYIEGAGPTPTSPPRELWSLRPDLFKIVPNAFGGVGQYVFKTAQVEKKWDVDPVTGRSKIHHVKMFNPLDIWYGMSPIQSVILNVDQANAANRWNLALLQNMAQPSGVLKVESTDANPGGMLTSEQRAILQRSLEERYSGPKNVARPMLLEGGMSWEQIGLSPKDMEWLEGKKVTASDICNAFGVPAQLLGFGQSTYANYKEAKDAFYIDTIMPLMDLFEHEFTKYIRQWFGQQYTLKYDRDDIEALTEKRQAKYASINNLNFVTQNEKRVMAGFEEQEGWDVYLIGNSLIARPEEMSLNDSTPQQTNSEAEEGDDNGEEKNVKKSNEEKTSDEEIIGDDGEVKEFKNFNLLNDKEKRTAWKRANALRQRLEKPFARSLEQDFEELARDLEKAAEGKEDPKLLEYALQKAIDAGMADISKTIARHIKFTVQDFGLRVFREAKSIGLVVETKANERTWEQWADSYIKRRTGEAITAIEGTTRKKVREVVKKLTSENIRDASSDGSEEPVNFAKELRARFEELTPARAAMIARTETSMASNNATIEAAKALEIPGLKKEWISVQDDRTRDGGNSGNEANHLEMNGVRIDLDEKFTVPPDTDMDGPGDPAGGADQVINCRCTLAFTASR
jgi:HK97 family phage portal protein